MKTTGYFAYAVRGSAGDNADITVMRHNIYDGILKCNQLREMLPDMEIYCPHEHEDLFQIPHRKGDVTSAQIIEQCCAIIRLCDYLFICSNPTESEGVGLEMIHGTKYGVTIVMLYQRPVLDWGDYLGKVIRCDQ